MSALIPLHFEAADVRMLMRDGEPWWVLKDVCAVLGIADHRVAARRLEAYQKGECITPSLGGPQEFIIVNEAGVYALTLTSRKETARHFARWLFTEVLPAIRRYGRYDPAGHAEAKTVTTEEVPRTTQERFLQEARKFEVRTGYSVLDIAGFSKNKLRQIELGASVQKMFSRGDLWLYMMSSGLDLHYIMLSERWTEREVRDAAQPPLALIHDE